MRGERRGLEGETARPQEKPRQRAQRRESEDRAGSPESHSAGMVRPPCER